MFETLLGVKSYKEFSKYSQRFAKKWKSGLSNVIHVDRNSDVKRVTELH